jgi:hypothetical protein
MHPDAVAAKTLFTLAYSLQFAGGVIAAFGLYTLWVRFRDDVDTVRATETPFTVQLIRWLGRSIQRLVSKVSELFRSDKTREDTSATAAHNSVPRPMMEVTFGGPSFDSERDIGDQFEELLEYVDEIRDAATYEVRWIRSQLAERASISREQFDILASKQSQISFSGFRRACIGIALILAGTILEIVANLK